MLGLTGGQYRFIALAVLSIHAIFLPDIQGDTRLFDVSINLIFPAVAASYK